MTLIQRTWHIRGTIHNADGSVFNQGRILAYNLFPIAGWRQIAESNIDQSTGAFELIFVTANFQEAGSPEVEFPTLQVRVTDYNYNPFWTSEIYTAPPTEMNLGDIVVGGVISTKWNICGNVVLSGNTPYTSGYVKVFDVRYSTETELGSYKLNAVGFYSVDYTKEQFQHGDPSITSPNLLVRVYSADGLNIANAKGPENAAAYVVLNVKVDSGEAVISDSSCKIYGVVKNKMGRPVSDVRITAFCLHYDVTETAGNPSGEFAHQQLGDSTKTDSLGEYSIPYMLEALPQGLLLDAKEACGKDKVSLYAKLEVVKPDANGNETVSATIFKPLVFNGKREQRIDFEVDVSSFKDGQSLFEELDDLLSIYRETIIKGSTHPTISRNKINDFLKDVDEFPLVVGRECRTEKEVKAYFMAYSLYYGLIGKLGENETSYPPSVYAQGIFALTCQEYVADLDGLVTIQAPTLQTAIFDAIAQNQINASINAESVLGLWKTATESAAVVSEMDDQFSPYHVFFLFVRGGLPLKEVVTEGVKTARVDLSSITPQEAVEIEYLMNAYYTAGSDYREMISDLEAMDSSEKRVDDVKLKLLIDLCDFGGWYGDFVVAAFSWVQTQSGITELKNLLPLPESSWQAIVGITSSRYIQYYPADTLVLPHEFPGTNAEEQKTLYVKKLMDAIVAWFPQYELYDKLASVLPAEWSSLFDILRTSAWEGFSLTDNDSKKYEEDNPDAPKISDKNLENLHILQRIFRLTEDAVAVAYLINEGFASATSIAQLDEDYFVAEHALGIGTKEQATQIHRVAKSFVAEATFKIGQFHSNLNESDNTLKATPRGVTRNLRVMAAGGFAKGSVSTNVAPPRIPSAISPTWKNLFGNINRNGATEGQSVLSASAYFIDLLNFFKANEDSYKRFLSRRPDLLDLQLTKANAEVAMPTIDLINELLECLVGDDIERPAKIIANQTPGDVTVESLRAEPIEWGNDEGKLRATKANLKLMTHAYPAMLPLNVYRIKSSRLLSNIPLTLYSVSESLGRKFDEKCCLFADELLHKILFKENTAEPWNSWGLRETGNNVYLPDKSEYKMDDPSHPTPYLQDKTWIEILSHVAILLDRTGLTFKELKEILSLKIFEKYNVSVHCPDALQYQLADINGYILVSGLYTAPSPVVYPSAEFFMELAAFNRFRSLLGWSVSDIALRYDELNAVPENPPEGYDPLSAWDRIQEMILRFGITPLNSLAWNGFELREEELESVFDVPILFERYREPTSGDMPEFYDDEYIKADICKAGVSCLSLKQSEVQTFLEHSGIFDNSQNDADSQHEKFIAGLNYVYRYGTFADKHKLAAEEFYLLQEAELGSMGCVRLFSRAIRKWQGASLPISTLEELLAPPDESVKVQAEAFLGIAKTAEHPDAVAGTFFASINESWNSVKVEDGFELEESEIPLIGDREPEYIAAYKDACSRQLVSLNYADVPFIDLLAQEPFSPNEAGIAYETVKKWLEGIFGEGAEQVSAILGKGSALKRLLLLYQDMIPVWYKKQIYTMLSQEFGIAADEKCLQAFGALLGKLDSFLFEGEAAFLDWLHYAKTDYWPQGGVQTQEINLSPYFALYKANLLYQYISGYVLSSANVDAGLALGFGWDGWNDLYTTSGSVLNHDILEKLVDAYTVSDACGNTQYSYAAIPPADDSSLNTPITNLKQLKQMLLIPQSIFAKCYEYAFGAELSFNVESWKDIPIDNWDETEKWVIFFKVYQLYLKTFTTPETLEDLFIELKEADLEETSEKFAKLCGSVQSLNDNLKSNYKASEWNKFIQGVSDEIRKARRDALSGFVCWESQNEENVVPYKYPRSFLNTNDLYAYYLIDVLMEPDMSMSRIVQANACLQLFVERCKLGLEGQTIDGANLFNDSALAQWEWMKNYQVWVANRKVFLYPENWLDVSLRDDKSAFYTELEDSLQEVGGDGDDMERIYAEYLEKVRETASLEIVGCCKEEGDPYGETVYTLHIIGRTRGEPHRYYYRKYFAKKDASGTWSPWELIEADITGDVVLPQLMNGRLYLAWPQYTQGQRQLNSGVASAKNEDGTENNINVPQLEFYVEIKLAWTCFNGKKWTGIKTTKNVLYDVSNDSLDFQLNEGEQLGDRYHYRLSCDGTAVTFQVMRTLLEIDTAKEDLKKAIEGLISLLKASKAANHRKKVKWFYKNSNPFASLRGREYRKSISYWENVLESLEKGEKKEISVNSSSKITQILKNRDYLGYSTQRIMPIGDIILYADGKDDVQKTIDGDTHIDKIPSPEDRGTLVSDFSPENTYLRRCYWVSNGEQALVYKDKEILSSAREYRLLPVNMDFYDPENETGHESELPFFYMDSENTFFVYPKADKSNGKVYKFVLMSHPIADEFFNQYRNGGKKELHSRGVQALEKVQSYYTMYSGYNYYFGSAIGYHIAGDWAAWDMGQSFFESNYMPTAAVTKEYPAPFVDFAWNSPNGIYNWELFFYVPVRIADKLISEEKYEDALEWLQLVFDPQGKKEGPEKIARWADDLPSGSQYWRFLPFYANPDADKTILESLSVLNESENSVKKRDLQSLIDQWKFDPFEPHLIAKQRLAAYQKFVVMKYLNVLIARGDELFTQDTTETVNLAIQFYIMAADILGPKSAEAPDPLTGTIKTAAEMIADAEAGGGLDWANTLLEYEDSMLIGRSRDRDTYQNKYPEKTSMIANISKETFYFSVPRNENLMAYWDTVADRLYKIRNSLNIEGVKRTLALFAPPIDPGMLVKARAAGLSLSDILADSGAALPHYRFKVIVAKALEIARDLRNMQETLLQALKDKDAEALAQLRLQHRMAAKKLSQNIFEIQMKELETEAASLEIEKQKKTTAQQHHKSNQEKLKTDFENGYSKTMQKVAELREKTETAKRIASTLYSIPDMDAGGIVNAFGGIDFHVSAYGGRKLGEAALTMAESYLSKALEREAAAAQQKAKGEEKRISEVESFEESIATSEIDQTDKQILINSIRQQRNEKEQERLEKELEWDEEEYNFLCDKFTNRDLHEWLVKQMTKLSKTMCKLTTKVAKMAEKCYHFEIGDTDMGKGKSFISNSYWDGAYSGLLSADRLIADLHAMEIAYMENDKNELEITRPVSLSELESLYQDVVVQSPLSEIKQYAATKFTIPLQLYSSDFGGHYFRRIRDVKVEVVAPKYRGYFLNAELSLNSDFLDLKQKETYIENRVGVQTMATSMAHVHDGKFDFNFKMDKFLPFEGAGAISIWNLSITGVPSEFNGSNTEHEDSKYSIDDVIIYVSYTARNGRGG